MKTSCSVIAAVLAVLLAAQLSAQPAPAAPASVPALCTAGSWAPQLATPSSLPSFLADTTNRCGTCSDTACQVPHSVGQGCIAGLTVGHCYATGSFCGGQQCLCMQP